MPPAELMLSLLPHLPRFAEEEGVFYRVPRAELIDALCQSHSLQRAIAENTVALLETLLDTLAVLDRSCLQNGDWCFVSFPAQLLATSVLTAMSDADSRLFAASFWNTQAIGNEQKDRQRDVLRAIEQARLEHHASHQAQPIRYCYVAWSIIKLDGRVLFYQREDTKKRFDKTAGDYGLIGGRANQNDVLGIGDTRQMLKALQSADSAIIKTALPETLKRELREEAGLLFGEHYQYQPWRRLKPYRQVQGAAPNHALTDYYLDIFQIELTLEGYLFLQQRLKQDERLAWISIVDIERGQFTDGKMPYIKALYDDFGGDQAALAAALAALPDSFTPGYLSAEDNYSFILPTAPGIPVSAGRPGKDKALDLDFNNQQLALLLGLAAHLRGFEFATLAEGLVLHPYGWIEVKPECPLKEELIALATYLSASELVMENRLDSLFRLSIKPETVFFTDSLFAFSVKSCDLQSTASKIPVMIERLALDTGLGPTRPKSASVKLSSQLVHDLRDLSLHHYPDDNDKAVKIEDRYKKGLHQDTQFKALGLRNLVRRDAGIIRFVLDYSCTLSSV